jgi:hypothetical protein
MDENSNGTSELVRFGDAPGNAIPAGWVEPVLRIIFADDQRGRAVLGQAIAEYMTGERFTKARSSRV